MDIRQDPTVQYVVEMAQKYLRPRRVILFGSRARGDARERSDYDFAFDLEKGDHDQWTRFVLDTQETSPTLCGLDLVNLAEARDELKTRIFREGKDLL